MLFEMPSASITLTKSFLIIVAWCGASQIDNEICCGHDKDLVLQNLRVCICVSMCLEHMENVMMLITPAACQLLGRNVRGNVVIDICSFDDSHFGTFVHVEKKVTSDACQHKC